MKLTKDPAADYEPMADVLDGLPGDVAAVLYSHADHTIHHVQSEDPSVYCPAFPRVSAGHAAPGVPWPFVNASESFILHLFCKRLSIDTKRSVIDITHPPPHCRAQGSTMLDPDFQVCRARGGTTKWFMRIEPFIAPRVHTVVVNASAPGGRDMRPFYSYKLPGVRDYALIHFKYPCFDNWLQKGVPGGRLGLKDWNVDMSNATEQVRGRVPVKLMFCLPSSPVAVERATAAIETMRRLFQPMKRVLMQTRNPEICDHGSPALCDPRYFWQCRCRADTCLRDDFGRELPIPHICSVSCCEDPGPWRHVRGGSRNTAGAADRRTSILRRPAG